MASTVVRRFLPAVLLAFAVLGGCSGDNPYQSAQSAATDPDTSVVNEFLPENQNVTDCIGAVERPNCGSKSKGGWQMYLTLGVLVAGITFIGWRVVRGARTRRPGEVTADG